VEAREVAEGVIVHGEARWQRLSVEDLAQFNLRLRVRNLDVLQFNGVFQNPV
jgi:hypothetical protein